MKKLLFLALFIAGSSFFNIASAEVLPLTPSTATQFQHLGYDYGNYYNTWDGTTDTDTSNGHLSIGLDPTSSLCFGGTGQMAIIVSDNASFYTDTGKTIDYYLATYGDSVAYFWECDGNGVVGGILADSTKIITTTPENETTTATSTSFTIGATGNVLTEDFVENETFLRVKLTYNGDLVPNVYQRVGTYSACYLGLNPFFCSLLLGYEVNAIQEDFEIDEAGYFSISTTTQILREGRYTMQTSIVKPLVSLLGLSFGDIKVASLETTFIAGTTTPYDNFTDEVQTFIQDSYDSFSSGTSCNIVSGDFNFGTCMVALFIPNSSIFQAYGQIPQIVATKFPFSYVSGIAYTWQQLETSATTTPSLVYNLHDLGIGSTTPLGNILPNQTVFASSTITEYLGSGVLNALKALAGVAIILALFLNIFFTVRNIFDKN